MTEAVAAGVASSTSIPSVSGAAAWIAVSTAKVNVTEDDGHPSQLPSIRRRTTPSSVTPTSSTSPPCDPR
jgi:hypothetical protein